MSVSLDLESDELMLRRIEGIGSAQPLPPAQPVRTDSPHSTIAKAERSESASPRFKPAIEEPHFMYGMIQQHGDLEKIADKQTSLFDAQVVRDTAEIDRLEIEKREKLRLECQSAQKKDTWGIFANVAQYLVSGAAIGVGIAIAATGVAAVAGGLLIASGVVGLTGKILHETGATRAIAAWFTKSEELQKSIASKIEMGMFCLSFGLGLAGGAWAGNLGAFSAATKAGLIGKIAGGIGIGASVGAAATRFGMSFVDKKVALVRGEMQKIETKTNQIYQEIYQNCRDVQNMVDTTSDIGDEVKQAISASRVEQE
jgi:gas vesicle protein